MAPATIERTRARQLSLDALAPVRAARLAPEAAVLAPATAAARAASTAAPSAGGTLDALVSGAWRELGAQRVAACPVCAAPMHPHEGAHGGHCGGCGATLA
jgi:hypothetical protein